MKKYLRYSNVIALGSGVVGMALSAWLFSAGTDEKGLYPAKHPAWILLGILTAAVVILFWLLSRQTGTNRSYRQNFPASLPAACGFVMAAIGLLSSGFSALESGKFLRMVAGALGILGSLPLFWAAFCRWKGQRCKLPVHILPCFFFALQLFVLGQTFGSEPEMYRYLYRFWALVSLVPACYWLWSFDVNLGRRPDCIFWCLVAGYCNLIAIIGSGHALLHLGMAVWMLTALPKLQYLPKQPKPAAEPQTIPAEENAPTTDLIEAEQVSQSAETVPAEDSQVTADPLAVELPDADAILEELLRDFGKDENA